ncbi:MAG: NYN domain-containing protein [Actinobacteria bacterium]|nr:NYN domain-containing protein [Actinomycetota bacterium]
MDAFTEHLQFKPKLEQKGVDTRITLDIVRLAQRRVYTAAILVAGDRDLAEPVRVARDEGCPVFLAVPEGGGLAPELRQLVDEVVHISKLGLEDLFEIS